MRIQPGMVQIQEAAHPALVGLPNVIGTGLGPKVVRGKRTGTMALAVFVSKKRPLSQLAPAEIIPAQINGLPTDVIEEQLPLRATSLLGDMETKDYRPLMGGTTITTELSITAGVGTLGCFVQPSSDPDGAPPSKVLLLTNFHVLFLVDESNPSHTFTDVQRDALGQSRASPSASDCCNDQISKFIRKGVYSETVDAACAEILTVVDGNDEEEQNRTKFRHEIVDLGVVAGVCDPLTGDCLGDDNFATKRGGATYRTEGVVTHANATFTTQIRHVYYDFSAMGRMPRKQIRIEPVSGSVFAAEGDSGAVVLNRDNKVIGLLHGATAAGVGFADNIGEVLTALGIKVLTETADNRGKIKTVPGPLSNGKSAAPAQRRRATALQEELVNRPRSKPIVAAFQLHRDEVAALINENRRVMVGWHRLGGPELMRHLSHAAFDPRYALPRSIGQRRWSAAIRDLSALLAEHGSAQLQGSLASHADQLGQLGGLRLEQILAAMGERADRVPGADGGRA